VFARLGTQKIVGDFANGVGEARRDDSGDAECRRGAFVRFGDGNPSAIAIDDARDPIRLERGSKACATN